MPDKVKLKDIARSLGVSVVTVSNALAGRRGVSVELRRQILARAGELGYSGGKKAESVPGNMAVSVLVPERYMGEGISFYWEMCQQVAMAASRIGGFTMVEIVNAREEADLTLPQGLTGGENDGIIAIGPFEKDYLARILRQADIPVVLLDFYDLELDCDAILRENYYGMYRLTDYLLSKGHRDIVFVGSKDAGGAELDRYFGFLRGMREAGISLNADRMLAEEKIENGDVTIALPDALPTAFAAIGGRTACILMNKLAEAKVRVPEDVSVVSFDDYLVGSTYADILTAYHVDMGKMADKAVLLLKERIGGNRRGRGAHFVDGWLVERASVKEI